MEIGMPNVSILDFGKHRALDRGGGDGYISGTAPGIVTVDGAPAGRQILLFERGTAQCAGETWSNPIDGTYMFDRLNPELEFDLIARDYTRTYSDVVIPAILPWPYSMSVFPRHSALPFYIPTSPFTWTYRIAGGSPPYTINVIDQPDNVVIDLEGNILTITGEGDNDSGNLHFTVNDSSSGSIEFNLVSLIAEVGQLDDVILNLAPVWYCKHNSTSAAINLGSGADGTVGGTLVATAPIYVAGDACVNTNGAGWINIPSSVLNTSPTNAITLGIVIKRNNNSGIQALIDRDPENGTRTWQWRFDTNSFEFIKIAGGVGIASATVTELNSLLVLFVRVAADGSITLYKNGVHVGSASFAPADYATDSIGLRIGRRLQGDSQSNYILASTMIWDHALDVEDIQEISSLIIPSL